MIRRPPISPLFPLHDALPICGGIDVVWPLLHGESGEDGAVRDVLELVGVRYVGSTPAACRTAWDKPVAARSEEHTPEIQSRQYLECRLLLEKKKATMIEDQTS